MQETIAGVGKEDSEFKGLIAWNDYDNCVCRIGEILLSYLVGIAEYGTLVLYREKKQGIKEESKAPVDSEG